MKLSLSKRAIISAFVIGAAVGLGGGVIYSLSNGETIAQTAVPTTSVEAQATASEKLPACLADKNALAPGAANDALGRSLASQLNDVAAGTKLDIVTTTDNGQTVTGSEKYSGDWGKYNYKATRDGDSWRVTALQLCK